MCTSTTPSRGRSSSRKRARLRSLTSRHFTRAWSNYCERCSPTKSGLVFQLPTKTYLYKKLQRVYAKAGIEKPEDIGFHITRHTWATDLTNHGATIADLVDTGAWVDPKMAQMYSHSVKSAAKRRMLDLPYYRPAPNLKVVG